MISATVTTAKPEYDYVIIGSGFGGSISALRLTETSLSISALTERAMALIQAK